MATRNGTAVFPVGLTFAAAERVTHGAQASFSAGVTFVASQTMTYNGQVRPVSPGVSFRGQGSFTWSGHGQTSIGVNFTTTGLITRGGSSVLPVGLSFAASGKLVYIRGSGKFSVGLMVVASGIHTHAGRALCSIGLTFVATPSIQPASVSKNAVLLFEATDSGNPSTFDAVIARDYSLVFADTTVSSYPKPYTLLN